MPMNAVKANQPLWRNREPRLLLESAVLGVAGALIAQAFLWMLRFCNGFFLASMAGYQPPGAEYGPGHQVIGPHGLWLVPAVTTLGGLISGFLVYRFAPEAEGHGTDTAVEAFHRREGLIRPRVPPLKMVASAITIGSGGSAGREGPIALITAGGIGLREGGASPGRGQATAAAGGNGGRFVGDLSHAHGDRRIRHRSAVRQDGI